MSTFTGDSRLSTELMYPNRKPTIPVKVDQSHRWSKGLNSYIGVNNFTAIGGEVPELLGDTSITNGDLKQTNGYAAFNPSNIYLYNDFTITIAFRTNIINRNQILIGNSLNSSGHRFIRFMICMDGNVNKIQFLLGDNDWSDDFTFTTNQEIFAGQQCIITARRAVDNQKSIVINNKVLNLSTYSTNLFNMTKLCLGHEPPTGNSYTFDGSIQTYINHRRALSDSDVFDLHRDLYQSLVPDIGA